MPEVIYETTIAATVTDRMMCRNEDMDLRVRIVDTGEPSLCLEVAGKDAAGSVMWEPIVGNQWGRAVETRWGCEPRHSSVGIMHNVYAMAIRQLHGERG